MEMRKGLSAMKCRLWLHNDFVHDTLIKDYREVWSFMLMRGGLEKPPPFSCSAVIDCTEDFILLRLPCYEFTAPNLYFRQKSKESVCLINNSSASLV